MNDLVICLQARARDGGVTYSLRSPRRRPLEGGPSSSGECRARPWHPVGVSLHLVVSLETLAHKRPPIVALEGLGARVGVALLHLLLLGHGHGLTLALEASGHERLALVALLVPGLGVARQRGGAHADCPGHGGGSVSRRGNILGRLRCRREETQSAAGAHEGDPDALLQDHFADRE